MAAKNVDSDVIKRKELDDMTTCFICTEAVKDPKALPCIHTFCMKCLQDAALKANEGPGDEMPCPICRRKFRLPQEDKLRSDVGPVLVQRISRPTVTNGANGSRVLSTKLTVTILDEDVFVASEKSSEVEVYDSNKLSFSRRWNLKELIDPMDIVGLSCNVNKCLYIFDCGGFRDQSYEILKVDRNGELIKNWSTGVDWGWGLSVTSEVNVILTVYNRDKLNEYASDGNWIRQIILPSSLGVCHPWHAIKLSNGDFVVSHGYNGTGLHRVCVVNADGVLKKSFGGKCGSDTRGMNEPFYLTVNRNGFIMVADRRNHRVLLLDSDLTFKRVCLILPEKLMSSQRPTKILLNELNGRMFVAVKKTSNNFLRFIRKHREDYGEIQVFNF